MTLDVNFIATIAERDVDLIVLEELSVSDEFRDWFCARTFGESVFESAIGAWHSLVGGALGESDLVFIFTSQAGQRIALLIGNKIDAPPQTKQGERYRQRGQKGVCDGDWDDFRTCVIAPERYLASAKHTESYDSEIGYEELLAFFSSRRFRDSRFQYNARIIQEAIEQNRRGYQPEYSEAMTTFVREYCRFAGEISPELRVQKAKPRPSGSTWVRFNPRGYPSHLSLYHQLTAGKVKLFFASLAEQIDAIREKFEQELGEGMSIGLAAKSVAISIEVPKVAPLKRSFGEEKSKLSEALEAAGRLDSLVRDLEGIRR